MLEWLRLRDYRCFEEAHLPLHHGTTLLVGQNAQGKTSLLEAVCVLMRLQSPRTSTRADLIRFEAKACIVEGALNGTKLRFGQSRSARRLAVNDAIVGRSAEYLTNTSRVVWMDHSDMNMIRGGSEHRRRFLDFAAAQLFPAYLPALRNYERALRSRNFLLKRDVVIPWRQVEAYSKLLDVHGETISACRHELVERLLPHVKQAHSQLSSETEKAAVVYVRGYEGDSLLQALGDKRAEEERGRTTACGLHRDDLLLEVNGRPAAAFASEGQQRTLCLALKLAQARVLEEGRGEPPLLLMDDIFGELDKRRRRALLQHLPQGSQKVITTTFVDWAEESELKELVYEVEAGRVRPR